MPINLCTQAITTIHIAMFSDIALIKNLIGCNTSLADDINHVI